jgi:RNA polymerase sigma-70 factor (ECF subfamily)
LADDEADQWRRLLARHGAALLMFARQWSMSLVDAEDALQNGFVRFWKSHRGRPEELAYLYACVRSAAMDIGRSRRRRDSHERQAVRDEPSSFDARAERAERTALIESALAQLPGDQREVVVMKIWGGLTFAQIAQVLEVPLSTAASRYRYALTRLEADLSEELAHE